MYAFETDSMQALAMVYELLDAGVPWSARPSRSRAGGREFSTGTALVRESDLGGIDLAALAARRADPVDRPGRLPGRAPRHGAAEDRPLRGGRPSRTTRSGPTTQPVPRPLRLAAGAPPRAANAYCVALFTLTQKDQLPQSLFTPVTTPDLAAGDLVDEDFTALLNPNGTIAAGPGATALQDFVNEGGTYVGTLGGGTTSARNAGLTTLNTVPRRTSTSRTARPTPGLERSPAPSTPSSPVAWGFDDDGFIYRDSRDNPIYDPETMEGNGTTIPEAGAAVSYADPLRSLGFSASATGEGKLDGRPAVVDQPFGAGRAVMIGHDAFYRSWKEGDERIVLNALLYPTTAALPPGDVERRVQQRAAEPVASPLPERELPAVKSRPVRGKRSDSAVRIQVARRHAAKLKRAVRAAKLPKAARKRVRYVKSRRTVTLVVRDARREANDHGRGEWVRRIIGRLDRARREGPVRAALSTEARAPLDAARGLPCRGVRRLLPGLLLACAFAAPATPPPRGTGRTACARPTATRSRDRA